MLLTDAIGDPYGYLVAQYGTANTSTTKYLNLMTSGAVSKMRVAVFVGCRTALGHPGFGDLDNYMTGSRGVDYAIGWREDVALESLALWERRWGVLIDKDGGYQMSFRDAAVTAKNWTIGRMQDNYPTWYSYAGYYTGWGIDSISASGDGSGMLYPAKYGN